MQLATGRDSLKGFMNVKVSQYKTEVAENRLHHADHVVCAGLADGGDK